MSDSNRTDTFISRETAWGETPDGTVKLRKFPDTGESHNGQPLSIPRRTRDSSRMQQKARLSGIDVTGGSSHDFVIRDTEELFAGALSCNSKTLGYTGNMTTSAGASTITADTGTPFSDVAADGKSWITEAPRFVKVTGGAQSGTAGIKRIVSITATVITLVPGSLTDSEAGVALQLDCRIYSNKSEDVSHLIERYYADVGDRFWFNGMIASQLTLQGSPEGIYSLDATWVGKNHEMGRISIASGYLTAATAIAGATTISVDTGVRELFAGQPFKIAGDDTLYESVNDLAADPVGGSRAVTVTPALVEAVTDNAVITLHNDSTVSAGDGAPNQDYGGDALNTGLDAKFAWLNGADILECFSNLSLTFDNSQRAKACMFKGTVSKPGKNAYRLTGSISFHFANIREYRRFQKNKTNTFDLLLQDPDGNAIGLSIEAFTYTSSPGPTPGGDDQDIILTLGLSAHDPGTPARYIAVEYFDA